MKKKKISSISLSGICIFCVISYLRTSSNFDQLGCQTPNHINSFTCLKSTQIDIWRTCSGFHGQNYSVVFMYYLKTKANVAPHLLLNINEYTGLSCCL